MAIDTVNLTCGQSPSSRIGSLDEVQAQFPLFLAYSIIRPSNWLLSGERRSGWSALRKEQRHWQSSGLKYANIFVENYNNTNVSQTSKHRSMDESHVVNMVYAHSKDSENEQFSSSLELDGFNVGERAEYQCVARNRFGADYSKRTVVEVSIFCIYKRTNYLHARCCHFLLHIGARSTDTH